MADTKAIDQITLKPGYGAADKIFDLLDTLGVSTNQDAYSGLMCDFQSLLVEGCPDVIVVKIYDDTSSGLYDGQKVWDFLNTVDAASLEPESTENIWGMLMLFEL